MVLIKGSSSAILKSKLDLIRKQMESAVWKISYEDITGTVCLCLNPYQEHSPIPVIITSNLNINEKIVKKEISFFTIFSLILRLDVIMTGIGECSW